MTSVLVCTGYYLPGFKAGGPIRTLANTVEWLGKEYAFSILTADRDLHEKDPYPDLSPGLWYEVGRARVRYLRPAERHFLRLRRTVTATPHDILYLNSYFSPFTRRLLLARKLGMIPRRPIILAPRGEFSAGALKIKSAKKRAYLLWSKWAGLCDGVIWQATSLLEQDDIRHWLAPSVDKKALILIAPNLPIPDVGTFDSSILKSPKVPGSAKVVFLGRISPIKNLHLALGALSAVQGELYFDIYGPLEDPTYWERCKSLIASLPPSVRVNYLGPVEPDRVQKVLSSYHLFLMISESENFGHAILEAFSAGCVVLTGNRTPWQDLAAKGIGWDIPPGDTLRVRNAVQEVVDMDDSKFLRMSVASRSVAQQFQDSQDNLCSYRRLFSFAGRVHGLGATFNSRHFN